MATVILTRKQYKKNRKLVNKLLAAGVTLKLKLK